MRRVLGLVALLLALTAFAAPASRAEAPLQQGWWYKLRQLGVPTPLPPDAPADGLYVAQDITGPLAVAAVRVGGAVPGTLELTLVPGQAAPDTSVSAFPATKDWTAAQGGAWEQAPTYDAGAGVAGKVASDGTSITWELPDTFPVIGGAVDVVLAATGNVPGTTAFEKPGADAYTPQAAPLETPAGPSDLVPEPSVVAPGPVGVEPLAPGGLTPALQAAAAPEPAGTYAATGKTFVGQPPPAAGKRGGLGDFSIPFPVLLLGAITGMTYGILAVGLVLIYRSNRIINFAHGEIGAFAAALLGLVVVRWHVPYWVAFPAALAVAGLVGGLSEVVVIRRLRDAPPVMSIVATLGLAQFLLLLSLVVNGQASAGRLFPQPAFLPEFDVGALRVTQAYSAMLFLTPLVVLGLIWFLRKSRSGLGIRAAASNPEAARLSGVFAARMSTLAWVIAAAVSAFTAILVLPTRGFASAQFLGPGLLLRALAAAVIARMVSLPIALVAGIAVGVIEQVLLWNYPRGGVVEAVLFAAIVTVLLVQRRRGTGRDDEKGSWAAVQPWAPLPDRLRQVWTIEHLGLIVAGVVAAVAILIPVFVTNSASVTFAVIMAFAIVGLSVGVVTGLSGQLSLGQFALAGIGAAVSAVVTRETGNYLLAFACAGVIAAVVSLVIGLPALRIRGLMLAVTTLGLALAAQGWLFQQSWVLGDGVDPGRPIIGNTIFDTGKKYYLFALIPTALMLLLARNVWRSGVGRRMRAIRDNEPAARAFTVRATVVKLQGFVLAGFLAGIGGAVYGHTLSRVSPTAFPIDASIDVAAMAVLGGIGVLAGPLIGAFWIIGIPQFLPLDNAGLAATKLGWLVLILYFPGGIAQMLKPLRERIVDGIARRSGIDPVEARKDAPVDSGTTAQARLALTPRAARPAVEGPLLRVEGIEKAFGGVRAVDGVSLEVNAGEIVGLIGPNGAGKTTLFELIGGFTKPDAGSVWFAGEDVSALGPEGRGQRGLIRSFQDAGLFPTMTVVETVMLALERSDPTRLGRALLGLNGSERRKEEQARELIAAMGLNPYRNKQIGALSTGTRRITELACLVALEPTLLLLDEPASGIAQRETEALGGLLAELKQTLDLTLVVIEHDIPMVMRLSDRVIAMESGRVIADGTPEEIRNDPLVIESYLGGDARAIERSGLTVTT